MKNGTLHRVLVLFLMLILVGIAGNQAVAQQNGLAYKAIKVGSDRNIDDTFKKESKEGWYPSFILKFEGDARMIFERPRDPQQRVSNLEYKAEVIGSGKKIDDTFNKMAADGWVPRFVFRTGALNQNWRILLERDPQNRATNLEYESVLIGQGNQVDDKFNQMASDGWHPLFVVEGLTDFRMLFEREKGQTERTTQFMAKTTRNIKQIDDLYNEHGVEGWEPMFLFKDETEAYRSLFQMGMDAEVRPLEFQAIRIDQISEIEDKFIQHGADGWYPLFVIKDIEEVLQNYKDADGINKTRTVENVRWRMLFGREKE